MKLLVSILLFTTILSSSFSQAENSQNHTQKLSSSAVESLSPALRELLQKEMIALETGMKSIIPAYASGNWAEIEHIADKMKNSYILKQSLTLDQKKELHETLPASFIKQDKYFHYLAGMLNHAAKNKKSELVGFYFSKLTESCVNCHQQFAIHKFPAFATEQISTDNHEH